MANKNVKLKSGSDVIYPCTKAENIIDKASTLQDKLVSGTNLKTVNGNSLLGSGDVSLMKTSSADYVYKWTANDVLTAPSTAISVTINFTYNGKKYTGISINTAGNITVTYSSSTTFIYWGGTSNRWVSSARDFCFETNPTGDLLDWLKDNATFYLMGESSTYLLEGNMYILPKVNSVQYTTTAPTAANTDGLKIAILSSEPSTRYDGWLYIIERSS